MLGSYSSDFKHIFLLARLADRGDDDVLGDVGGGGGTSGLPSYNFPCRWDRRGCVAPRLLMHSMMWFITSISWHGPSSGSPMCAAAASEAKSGASLYLLGPLAGLFHLAENGFF